MYLSWLMTLWLEVSCLRLVRVMYLCFENTQDSVNYYMSSSFWIQFSSVFKELWGSQLLFYNVHSLQAPFWFQWTSVNGRINCKDGNSLVATIFSLFCIYFNEDWTSKPAGFCQFIEALNIYSIGRSLA